MAVIASVRDRQQLTVVLGIILLFVTALSYRSHRRSQLAAVPDFADLTSPVTHRLKQQLIDTLYNGDENKTRLRRLVLTAVPDKASKPRTLETILPGAIHDVASVSEPLRAPVPAAILTALDIADPHILYGIATTAERLDTGITPSSPPAYKAIAHYATPNTHFYIILPESDRPHVSGLLVKLHAAGINAEIALSATPRWQDRWIETVEQLAVFAAADVNHSRLWYGMVDDDTFFPSISDVWTMLGRYPDPATKAWYIGSSDARDYIRAYYGFHAMGGAGIFLSGGLLRELAAVIREPVCKEGKNAGDVWLGWCLLNSTMGPVKISWEKSLHMHHNDMTFADSSFEGPGELSDLSLPREDWSRLLSVHHWRLPKQTRDLPSMLTVSRKTGARNLFHRYIIWDAELTQDERHQGATRGFWTMSNGYSLVHHNLERPKQRARAEWCGKNCWDPAAGDSWTFPAEQILQSTELRQPSFYTQVFYPVRPMDGPEMSTRYKFTAAIEGHGDEPWTGYFVHETEDLVDIIEVTWV